MAETFLTVLMWTVVILGASIFLAIAALVWLAWACASADIEREKYGPREDL